MKDLASSTSNLASPVPSRILRRITPLKQGAGAAAAAEKGNAGSPVALPSHQSSLGALFESASEDTVLKTHHSTESASEDTALSKVSATTKPPTTFLATALTGGTHNFSPS
jgi:hypothetical protein